MHCHIYILIDGVLLQTRQNISLGALYGLFYVEYTAHIVLYGIYGLFYMVQDPVRICLTFLDAWQLQFQF